MEKEIWKWIPEFKKRYKISNYGKIKSYCKSIKIRKHFIIKGGYHQVALIKKKNEKPKIFMVHRLVLTTFRSLPTLGVETNHKDGNKDNNYINNLEWVTPKQNMIHSVKTGLYGKRVGEQCPQAIFTTEKVKKIRELYKTGKYKQSEIGRMFNVKRHNIHCLVHKKTWKHIN